MISTTSSAGRSMVVVGTTAWSAPWLTEQNLAFALAARHPTLYVEPPDVPGRRSDTRPRLRVEAVGERTVVVFRPLVLPFGSKMPSSLISAPLYRAQVRAITARLGFDDAVVISGDARPGVIDVARECLSAYIVKDWVYEDADLIGRSPRTLLRERDAMCAGVDLVLAISPSLQESLAKEGIAARLLRHGFHADLVPAYDRPPPPDIATLPRPHIVFSGRVDGRLDIEKVRSVARRFDEGSVVLIGPVSRRMPAGALLALDMEPNIHLIGVRDRMDLPAYLAHADCLLIPYLDTVWSHHGSPLKLWDYLYAGPPIVGSGYSILSDFEPLVRFSNDDATFVAEVARVLEADGLRADRREFALRNTWEDRGRELEALIDEALATPSARMPQLEVAI